MHIQLKPNICQEGGQFYHEPTGRVIADYGYICFSDLEGAVRARETFAMDFPEFVIHDDIHTPKFTIVPPL